MNTTKWEEVRAAMYALGAASPRWRTRDLDTGYVSDWDGEWFHHFRIGAYQCIEWVEIEPRQLQDAPAIFEALRRVHVPGERIDNRFRIYGYQRAGQFVDYL